MVLEAMGEELHRRDAQGALRERKKSATGGARADEGVRPTFAGSGAVAGGVVFGVAKGGEGFQDRGDFGKAGAGEIAGDDFGCNRGGCLHEVIAHGPDAFG